MEIMVWILQGLINRVAGWLPAPRERLYLPTDVVPNPGKAKNIPGKGKGLPGYPIPVPGWGHAAPGRGVTVPGKSEKAPGSRFIWREMRKVSQDRILFGSSV